MGVLGVFSHLSRIVQKILGKASDDFLLLLKDFFSPQRRPSQQTLPLEKAEKRPYKQRLLIYLFSFHRSLGIVVWTCGVSRAHSKDLMSEVPLPPPCSSRWSREPCQFSRTILGSFQEFSRVVFVISCVLSLSSDFESRVCAWVWIVSLPSTWLELTLH